jgi:hypothetical protein
MDLICFLFISFCVRVHVYVCSMRCFTSGATVAFPVCSVLNDLLRCNIRPSFPTLSPFLSLVSLPFSTTSTAA